MVRSDGYEVQVVGEAKPDFAFTIDGKRFVWWRGMATVIDADGQFVLLNPGIYLDRESQTYKYPAEWIVEEYPRGKSAALGEAEFE